MPTASKQKKQYVRPRYTFEGDEVALRDLEKRGIDRVGNALEAVISADLLNKSEPGWVKRYIVTTLTPEIKILAHNDEVFMGSTKLQEQILFEFISALKQFPLTAIQQCQREDCKAFFVKVTVKEEHYCSNKCTWIVASRLRRKVQPKTGRGTKRRIHHKKAGQEVGLTMKIEERKDG